MQSLKTQAFRVNKSSTYVKDSCKRWVACCTIFNSVFTFADNAKTETLKGLDILKYLFDVWWNTNIVRVLPHTVENKFTLQFPFQLIHYTFML